MKNPWTTKNPFLSLWLSGANTVMNTARGHATAQAQRATADAWAKGLRDANEFWSAWLTPPAPPRARRATGKPRRRAKAR